MSVLAVYSPDYETPVVGSSLFIQWKGTSLCADFRCEECGEQHHICGADFAYQIKCTCGAVYQMPHTVAVKRIDQPDGCYILCDENGGKLLNTSR